MADVDTNASSIFALNETQLDSGSQAVYITWYVFAGCIGLPGNIFVFVIFCNAKRLQTARIVVSWLACVDLFGCLTIPLRYLILFRADKLPQPVCIAIPPILFFSYHLTLLSLVVTAIERYRALRFPNNHNNGINAIIYVLIVSSVLLSVIMAAMSRFILQQDKYNGDGFSCTSVGFDSFTDYQAPIVVVAEALVIFCSISLITALYIKIALILRRRVGTPNLQQPGCSPDGQDTAPSEEQNQRKNSRQDDHWKDVILECNPHQELAETTRKLNKDCTSKTIELKRVADVNEVQPEFVSITSLVMNEMQRDNISTLNRPGNIIRAPSKSTLHTAVDVVTPVTSSSKILPHAHSSVTLASQGDDASLSESMTSKMSKAASTTEAAIQSQAVEESLQRVTVTPSNQDAPLSLFHQLPGAVAEDNEKLSTMNHLSLGPRQISLIQPKKEEFTIPTLEIDERNNHIIGRNVIMKTTLMLFIATAMCIITYGLVALTLMFEATKAADFFLEFLLINHVINPFVYNFVNEGYREECRRVFKKMKL